MLCWGLTNPHCWGRTFLPALFTVLRAKSAFSLASETTQDSWCWASTRNCFPLLLADVFFPGSPVISPHVYCLLLSWVPSADLQSSFSVTHLPRQCSDLWSLHGLVFPDPPLHHLTQGDWWATAAPSPCVVAWKFSQGGELGQSLGSLHLFPGSLSFTAWSPFTWK